MFKLLSLSLMVTMTIGLCARMENLLRSKGYWHLVESGIPTVAIGAMQIEAEKEKMEALQLKDMKVKNYLFQAINRTIMETILDKGNSKSI